jgi:drug/metabolite transporter (DMT)-like permease
MTHLDLQSSMMAQSGILVVSAFLHALWNSWAKKHKDPDLKISGTLSFAAVFALLSIPFFSGPHFTSWKGLAWSLTAGISEAGYFFALGKTFQKSSFGTAYMVMRGSAMIITWVISVSLLGEPFGWNALFGVTLVLAGLYFTAFSVQEKKTKLTFNIEFLKNQNWSLICAFFISGYHFAYGHSLREGSRPATLFAISLWLSILLIFGLRSKSYFTKATQLIRLEWKGLFVSGFVCNLSFLLFLIGLQNSGAGAALTLRNTSVIFAQGLAFLMGEKISKLQWLGAILVATGAATIGLIDNKP